MSTVNRWLAVAAYVPVIGIALTVAWLQLGPDIDEAVTVFVAGLLAVLAGMELHDAWRD